MLNLNEEINRVPQYKWAKEVKEMFDYTCVCCGKKTLGRQMHAHHVVPRSQNNDLALVLENGVALCEKCHMHLHFCMNNGFESAIIDKVNEVAENGMVLQVPKGRKETVQELAKAQGHDSVNGYINALIRADMGLTEDEWKGKGDAGAEEIPD